MPRGNGSGSAEEGGLRIVGDAPHAVSVPALFERRATHSPDAVAISLGARRVTYGELDARSNQLANRLAALGVEREARVAVVADRSVEAVAAFLGVVKAGAAYVPLDPALPRARQEFVLADTAAAAVVAQAHAAERLPQDTPPRVALDPAFRELTGEPTDRRTALPGPDDLLYVIYTSGSSGTPKGVAVEHRNLISLIQAADRILPREEDEGVLLVNQLAFDVSAFDIWATLLGGARLVVHPDRLPDAVAIGETIRRGDVSLAVFPTGLLHQMVDGDPSSLSALDLVCAAGDVLSPDHAARLLACAPDCRLVNAYGPTEATVLATYHELAAPVPQGPIPIGRPFANTNVHVLDEDLRAVPPGAAGELCIGGAGVARGYLNRPELTAAKFVSSPLDPDERFYRTGDRVRMRDDGELEFLGRLDAQVKVRGYRIEPGEVEAQLSQHPDIAHAVVVAREDLRGHKRLVGYAVPTRRDRIDVTHVRAFLEKRLPGYMIPSAFVVLAAFPLTSTGKIARAALPDPRDERPPTSARPMTPTEISVATACCRVLRTTDVGPEDDFFELGGDSLLALALLGRLREAHGVELPIAAVFEQRSVSAIAAEIDRLGARPQTDPLPPLERQQIGNPAAVSFSQAQVCFLSELEPDALPYQFQALIWLRGTLDVPVLERALSELVRRHEILRTSFPKDVSGWVQLVHEPFAVRLPVVDRRDDPDPDAALRSLAEAEFRQRIELDRLPLVRWTLVRLHDERHALVHVEHHVVHDGWSFAQLMRELAALYRAFAADAPSPLCEPAARYRDFASWQRAFADHPLADEQLSYWRERLAEPPPPPALPHDRPRPARQRFRGGSVRAPIPPALADRLRAFARGEGVTLYMAMLTAFLAQLWRYSGQHDLIVGAGLANRRVPGSDDVLGMFVNTVAMRVDLAGEPTVSELLARVRAVAVAAYANQELPFERVVQALGPARAPGTNPYYQLLFSFHDSPLADLGLSGLSIQPEEALSNGSAKADINVVVINRRIGDASGGAEPGDLVVVWEYNSDLFDRESAERMVAHYVTLLEALAGNTSTPVSRLPLMGAAEQRATLGALEGPAIPYDQGSIADVLAARVAETPEAVAVVAGETELTYRQLESRAERLAARLQSAGVSRGARVGVCLQRGIEMVVTLVAVLKAGGAYVALDPDSPSERLKLLIEDADVHVVVSSDDYAEAVPRPLRVVSPSDLDPETPYQPTAAGPGDAAYVAYTSGSTGVPKGVEVLQRGVLRLARSADYVELGPDETLLALAPLSFDASTFEIWGALLSGARLAVAPPGPLAPTEIADCVHRYGVTTLWLTAGLFHRFVDHAPDGVRALRQLLAGGDVLSPVHVERALRLLPPDGVLVNGYGPTEATTFTCVHRMRPGDSVEHPVPIGRPIPNTHVYVLDEHGAPVPIGVPGELYIGGDGVASGYVGDPALTAARFVDDPLAGVPGARMYRAGDRVRQRRDGVLEFLGRTDQQVKIRGFRIEPGEIEHHLMQHPSVADAVVVASDNGLDDRRLVAYIVFTGVPPDASALRAFLAQRLPAYLIPAEWVRLESLPVTATGKVDRSRLPHLGSRWSDPVDPPRARTMTDLERTLVGIWQDVLGVRPIDLDDDFFALGGHSLLAVELFATIEQAIGARVPLATIFEAPTVAQLAQVLADEGWDAPWSSLVPLNAGGPRTPLFCVTAGDANTVGFGALARRLGPDQPFYALQPRGLDGRRPFDASVERMARHYIREIARVQRTGPYLLAGRCLGGLVAFEMARQLRRSGNEVGLVAVLDSIGPRWTERRLANGLVYDELMSAARRRAAREGVELGDPLTPRGTDALLRWLRQPAVVGADATVNRYMFEAYLMRPDVRAAYPDLENGDGGRLVDWCWVSGRREMGMADSLLPPPTDAAATLNPRRSSRTYSTRKRAGRLYRTAVAAVDIATQGRLPGVGSRREERLRAVANNAADRYRAGFYDGRVTLIRSDEFADEPLLARWHEVAAEVDERLVEGTHRSMLREPDVASLATCLADLLGNAAP